MHIYEIVSVQPYMLHVLQGMHVVQGMPAYFVQRRCRARMPIGSCGEPACSASCDIRPRLLQRHNHVCMPAQHRV